MASDSNVGVTRQYHKSMTMGFGEEITVLVGAVEVSPKEVMLLENKADFKIATAKELNKMAKRRFLQRLQPGEDT